MRLHLDQIPDEGWVVDFDGADGWALAAATAALEGVPDRLSGQLIVRRMGKDLAVTGQVGVALPRPCDRCGEGLNASFEGPVKLNFTPTPDEDDAAAAPRQLSPGELDVGFYDGEHLDLAAVVSEQLVLMLPIKLACDLEGIEPASECGEERIKAQENEPRVDPRFAVLAGLKIES